MTRISSKRNGSSVKSSAKASVPSDDVRERILDFIVEHVEEHGYPPTLREIGKHIKQSAQSVMIHLDALEASGFLTRAPGIPRSLRVRKS